MEYHAHGEGIAEARFYATVDGVEVSCSPDLLTRSTLYDYKFTDNPPMYSYPYTHHKEQVEFNAYVCRHAEKWDLPASLTELPFDPREHPVEHVAIVYLGPKFVKLLEVEQKDDVFDSKTGKFKKAVVPHVWSDKLVMTVFRPRIHIFRAALESYTEWPEPWTDPVDGKVYRAEDVWGGDEGWLCPGPPLCNLPDCLARRRPERLVWDKRGVK